MFIVHLALIIVPLCLYYLQTGETWFLIPGLSLINSRMVSSELEESLDTSGLRRITWAPQSLAIRSISSWSVDTQTLRTREHVTRLTSHTCLTCHLFRPQVFVNLEKLECMASNKWMELPVHKSFIGNCYKILDLNCVYRVDCILYVISTV